MTLELVASVSLERQKELASLARMVAFVRRTAQELNVQLPTYCLGMALDAVIDEMKVAGIDVASIVAADDYPTMIVTGYH
jgi:hypothetical protein